MHKVHHSDRQPETDSNYATVLSIWDRLAKSFKMRDNPKTLLFGLEEEPRNYREAARQDHALAARFYQACLERGVYFHHVSPHHGFSSAHTLADIDETLNVVEDAAKAVSDGKNRL